jgi:hypothetical protein
MRAFIQCTISNNILEPINPNVFNAYKGLEDMGFECVKFSTLQDLADYYHSRGEIIVGGIGIIRKRLKAFDIDPITVDYPEELKEFLGRTIQESTLSNIANNPETWPIFIKSKEQKRITGKVIRNASDLVGLGYQEENPEIYISEVMDFVSEYRVFVRYGEVLDCKHYWGDPMVFPDAAIIKAAISKYQSAPDAYGIDFAVTKEGKTVLIEVNDAWALGCYGLEMHLYAKFLITRWAQITNTIDEFFYI